MLQTMNVLPSMEGHRYSPLQLGPDRVGTIRAETEALQALAALVCGCAVEALTMDAIERKVSELRASRD